MRAILGLLCVAALVLVWGSGRGESQKGGFFRRQERLTLPKGIIPSRVGAADLDGDGKLDVIVSGGSAVLVYRGDGNGKLLPESRAFPAGPTSGDLAIADLNGDGKPDIVVANHGHPQVTVLLGDGRGGLVPAPGSPLRLDIRPHAHSVAIADVNGDRKPDLILNDMERGGVLIALGNGDGSFRPVSGLAPVGARRAYFNVVPADFDADGRIDLAVPLHPERAVAVLRGLGGGRFAAADSSPIAIPRVSFSVAAGDVDGDGKPDILVATYSGSVANSSQDGLVVLLNRGGLHFVPAEGSPFTTGGGPTSIAVGDIDGDGVVDIAVGDLGSGEVSVFLGGKRLRPAPGSPLQVGRQPNAIALADLDGDGRKDLIVGNSEGELRIYFGQ